MSIRLREQGLLPEVLLCNFRQLREIASAILDETDGLPSLNVENGSGVFKDGFSLAKEVREYERGLIKHALMLTKGNQTRATKILGIKLTTLNSKIKNLNISI
jgi:DNA-binding NtrC family response regulator